jgi:hypothetical protein
MKQTIAGANKRLCTYLEQIKTIKTEIAFKGHGNCFVPVSTI